MGVMATTHVVALRYDISIFIAKRKNRVDFSSQCKHAASCILLMRLFPEMMVLPTGCSLIVFPCKEKGLGIPGFEERCKLANNKNRIIHKPEWRSFRKDCPNKKTQLTLRSGEVARSLWETAVWIHSGRSQAHSSKGSLEKELERIEINIYIYYI